MRHPNSVVRLLSTILLLTLTRAVPAQHLPEGAYHENRQRTVDILHYQANLVLAPAKRSLTGEATLRLTPLGTRREFSLDAIGLKVANVRLLNGGKAQALRFSLADRELRIELGRDYGPADTLTVAIDYACRPNSGMYFEPDPANANATFVYTYGEGGLHANWLPVYSDVNDKFSSEMIVTVPESYSAISNGKLLEVTSGKNGTRTFHWKQTLPHANYLMAVYAGQYEKGDLPPAFGDIPMSYWVQKGRLNDGAYAFRNTPKMVEFFSTRLGYRYPWDKYDQITVPNYGIGAMEHTGVTGHRWSVLRDAAAPLDFGPNLRTYYTAWTAEGTISHELAHHWFGDNLTCRNLSVIWLNESFATYCQWLWDEENLGEQTLLFNHLTALDLYLAYVAKAHIIRPLEYHHFDKPDDMYNTEHTYLKGAMVLHMLRRILGDDEFFSALRYYLHKHEFQNVESNDFKIAIEEATGRNLDWFFDDWVYGGGHPVLEVSYDYLPGRNLISLSVSQVQPLVDGQGLFTLPVRVTVATASGQKTHDLWVEEVNEDFVLETDGKPLMVSFDGEGSLVADIRFPKQPEELLYQLQHDALAGRIRALRQLAQKFSTRPETLPAFSQIISGDDFWGLQAEAALQLGAVRTPAAEQLLNTALKSPAYRVRKAAALALARFGTASAAATLRQVVAGDSQTDVVAAALISLAKADPNLDAEFVRKQLGRAAWYDEITIACMDAFAALGRPELVSTIKPYVKAPYNQHVRLAALEAWKACKPSDPELHKTLVRDSVHAPYSVQLRAIEMLGELYVETAKKTLEQIAANSGDVTFAVAAKRALDKIESVEEQEK